jgi:hypothetical protein
LPRADLAEARKLAQRANLFCNASDSGLGPCCTLYGIARGWVAFWLLGTQLAHRVLTRPHESVD